MNTEIGANITGSSWKEILQKDHRRSLTLLCLSIWLHASMVTAMSTMVPSIVADIGGISLAPWAFALYEIGSITVGIGSGLLVYRYRMRSPMSLAALLFALGSVICALAPIMPVVVIGRLFQGIGGGALVAISFIGIGVFFPERLMPKAMAVVSAIWGALAFMGPLIGALFVQHLSWQSAFWFFSALSVVLTILIRRNISEGSGQEFGTADSRFPIRRLLLLSVGVLFIAAAGIDVSAVKTPIFVLAGIVVLVWFLRMDARGQGNRLLPKSPISFRNRAGAGLTMILCFALSTIAISVYGPLFIIQLHQASVIQAGYVVGFTALGWSVGALLVSGILPSQDTKAILLGTSLLTFGIIGFIFAITEGPVYLLAILTFLEGAGFGTAWASILRRLLSLVDSEDRERVSASIPTVHRLGFALGAAYIGIIANARGLDLDATREATESVARWVYFAGLPFALLGLLAAWRFVSRR